MRMSECINEIAGWMRSNRLQLNTAKTEFPWSTTSHRLHQLPQSSLRIGYDHYFTSFCRSSPRNMHRQ